MMAESDDNNEMQPELLGLHALNPFTTVNAPARSVMFAGHFAQRPVIAGSEPPIIMTGVEEEMGKYTFSVSMPEDGRIVKVVQRYRNTVGEDGIDPRYSDTVVIYRSTETGEIGHFILPYHRTNGTSFGFQYVPKPALDLLAKDREFQKGTVFLDSPAVHGESNYTYGVNLNMAVMSHPFSALDGYVVSDDVPALFGIKMYETRTIDFGANAIPLNINGDENVYKIVPDIGEKIRPDGLVAALREDNGLLSPSMTSKKDLMEVNHFFDRCIYAPAGEGTVVGLEVIHTSNVNRQLPPEMTEGLWKYVRSNENFYREIIKVEEDYLREARRYDPNARFPCSVAFHRLLMECRTMLNYRTDDPGSRGKSLTLIHRKERLDGWRINITIEYDYIGDKGFKITCQNGG